MGESCHGRLFVGAACTGPSLLPVPGGWRVDGKFSGSPEAGRTERCSDCPGGLARPLLLNWGSALLWTSRQIARWRPCGATVREPRWPLSLSRGAAPGGAGLEAALLPSQPHALLSVKQIPGLLFFKRLEILLTFN